MLHKTFLLAPELWASCGALQEACQTPRLGTQAFAHSPGHSHTRPTKSLGHRLASSSLCEEATWPFSTPRPCLWPQPLCLKHHTFLFGLTSGESLKISQTQPGQDGTCLPSCGHGISVDVPLPCYVLPTRMPTSQLDLTQLRHRSLSLLCLALPCLS